MDERRRRRLAVNGDGTDSADVGDGKPLPDCVPAELCAASPWIPRAPWKLWTLCGLLLAGVSGVLALIYRTPNFGPEWTPVLDPLFRGDRPRLMTYLETMFWTLSGQLALLIGWHRSHSRLDFRGRYRCWPWIASACFFCGLCVATNLHHGLGTILQQFDVLPSWGPHSNWLVPALAGLLPIWLLADYDVRRSTASLTLLRTSVAILMAGGVLGIYTPPGIDHALLPLLQSGCGLIGAATMMLTFWVQGWYVAYVTPDPPTAAARTAPKWRLNILGWLFGWLLGLFRRREVEPAAPTKRRKKTEEAGTTKRKRKTKRTTKPRTRKAAEEELETEDEEAAEDEELSDESGEEDAYDEEEESVSPRAGSNRSNTTSNSSRPAESTSAASGRSNADWSAATGQDEGDDEEDSEDGQMWRVDGPSADQLKGLSKRQRRALIKQHRDQQRANRG